MLSRSGYIVDGTDEKFAPSFYWSMIARETKQVRKSRMLEIEVLHPKIHKLLDPSGDLIRVADGFDFTEGPIWDRRTGALIFSDILGNSLYRWTSASGPQTLRRYSYMANRNAFDLCV